MTVHQLYDGGPANSTIARTQWPAYPFSAADPAFAEIDVAQHYGSGLVQLRKTLDFANDYALQAYFRANAVAAADVLNLILLPPESLLLGFYAEVEYAENNATALTISFATAAGVLFGDTTSAAVPLDMTAVASNFSAPNAPWVTGTGGSVVSLATARYIGTQPDMVQATLATIAAPSLAGFSGLRLSIAATIMKLNENKAKNYPSY